MAGDRLFRYAALGDSTSVGVGAGNDGGFPIRLGRKLKAQGISIGFLNLARSGATSAEVAEHQVGRVGAKPPDLVTLAIGGNDAWRLVPASVFAGNLRKIVEPLAKTDAHVVVCNIGDLGLSPAARMAQGMLGITPDRITARVRELNVEIDALARLPRFTVVDVFAYSQAVLRSRPEFFSQDGFHPSPLGYESWAEICLPPVLRIARDWAAAA